MVQEEDHTLESVKLRKASEQPWLCRYNCTWRQFPWELFHHHWSHYTENTPVVFPLRGFAILSMGSICVDLTFQVTVLYPILDHHCTCWWSSTFRQWFLIITLSADGPAPNGARPSAGTVLITLLDMILLSMVMAISNYLLITRWHHSKLKTISWHYCGTTIVKTIPWAGIRLASEIRRFPQSVTVPITKPVVVSAVVQTQHEATVSTLHKSLFDMGDPL